MNTAEKYLRPEVIRQVARLDLRAKFIVEGFLSGLHSSPFHGFSVEFSEHRKYVPGDDPKDLDWRVIAKSDRNVIRQYIEETNLRATLAVDVSGSMKYTGDHAARVGDVPLSKLDYAKHLAAALAYLFVKQGDAAGLVTFDREVRSFIRAGSRTGDGERHVVPHRRP